MGLVSGKTFEEWVEFTNTVSKFLSVDPLVFEYGLNNNISPPKLTDAEFKRKKGENSELIKVANPYLDYLSLSFAETPHVVTITDKEGWVLELRGCSAQFRGPKEKMELGTNWSDHYIKENGIGIALKEEKPVLIYRKDGEDLDNSLICIGVPIKDKRDNIRGALAVSAPRQNTHLAHLTMVLSSLISIQNTLSASLQLQDKLARIEKLLATGSLLATTVHDLKNPLATIRGISQLGEMKSRSNGEKDYFKRIIKQVDELFDMLNDLLGTFKDEKCVVHSPDKVISEVIQELEPICRTRKIELDFIVNNSKKVIIHTKLFKRAIHNLLGNGIQALDKRGQMIIRVDVVDESLLIEVRDDGPGIPLEIQHEIFEPFVHGRRKGTGLGLYMAHYVVTKVHQGQIWFETHPDQGTAFYVKLPLQGGMNNKNAN